MRARLFRVVAISAGILSACNQAPAPSSSAPTLGPGSPAGMSSQAPNSPGAAPTVAAVAPAPPKCDGCGYVEAIVHITKKGEGSGLGAVLGGVAGGVVGHQMGQGNGNTAMTVLGAAGGAYAGNEVEKNAKKKSYWQLSVKMDTGQSLQVPYGSKPPFHEGDRVKLVDGQVALAAN